MNSYFKHTLVKYRELRQTQASFIIDPNCDTTSVWIPNIGGATIKYRELRQTDFKSDELAMLLVYFKVLYPKEFRQLKKSSTWRTDLAMWAYMHFRGKFIVKKLPVLTLKITYGMTPSYEIVDCSGLSLEDFQKICLGEVGKMYYLEDGTKVMPAPYPYFCDTCGNYTNHTLSLAKSPVYGSEWEAAIVCDDCGAVITSIKHDHLLSKQIFNDAVSKIMTVKE